MKKIFLVFILVVLLWIPVHALEFNAPEVPKSGAEFMPEENKTFGEDLWFVIKAALEKIQPSVTEAGQICVSILAVVLCTGILREHVPVAARTTDLAGTAAITVLLITPSKTLIKAGLQTATELSEYGKLLMPVLTGALAAQGNATSAGLLYTGTMLFAGILMGLLRNIIVPMLYIFITLSIASSAFDDYAIKKLKGIVKWAMTWCIKIVMYVFTGYMGITGVISGTTDAAALKATKLAISGVVPVVGSIMADASDTILVSAQIMKNSAGSYGLIAIFSILIGPFLNCGVHYLLLKITAAVSCLFDSKKCNALVNDASGVMGYVLAMIGAVSLMLLVAVICFMKGGI